MKSKKVITLILVFFKLIIIIIRKIFFIVGIVMLGWILTVAFSQQEIERQNYIIDQGKQESSKFETSIMLISIVVIILTLLISFFLLKKQRQSKQQIKNKQKTTIKLNQAYKINNLHHHKSNLLKIKQTLTLLYTIYKNLLYIKTKMYNQSNLLIILSILQTQQQEKQTSSKIESNLDKKDKQNVFFDKNDNNDHNNDRKQNLINMRGQVEEKKINQQSIIGVQDNEVFLYSKTTTIRFEDDALKRLQKIIYININQLYQQVSALINQLKQSKIILNPQYFNTKNNSNDISQSSSNPTNNQLLYLSDLIKYNIYIKHYIIDIQQKLQQIKQSSTQLFEQNKKQYFQQNHKSNIQLIKSNTLLINEIIKLLNVIQQIIQNEKDHEYNNNDNENEIISDYNNKQQQSSLISNKIKNNKMMFSQLKQTISTLFNNNLTISYNQSNNKNLNNQSIIIIDNLSNKNQQNLQIIIHQLLNQISKNLNVNNNNDDYHQPNYQKEKQIINRFMKQYIYEIYKEQSLIVDSSLSIQQTVKPQQQTLVDKNQRTSYQQKTIKNHHNNNNQNLEKKIQCLQKIIQQYQSNLINLKQKHNKVTQAIQKYQDQSNCYYKNQSNSTSSVSNNFNNNINIGTQIKIYQDQQLPSNRQSTQMNNSTSNNLQHQKTSSQTNQIFSQKNKIKFIKQLDKLMIRNRIKKQQEFIQHKMKLQQQQQLLTNQE